MAPFFDGARWRGRGRVGSDFSEAWRASQRGLQNSDIWRRILTGLPHNLHERCMLSGGFARGDMTFQANTKCD